MTGTGPGPPSPAQHSTPQVAKEVRSDRRGPSDLCRPLLPRSWCDGCSGDHSAGNVDPMAPRRISPLLALEIAAWQWTAKGLGRDTQIDPRDELCQPFVGRATNPWRASQARNRCRPDECGKVYASEATATISGLEDLPDQPCRWNRSDGPVRGTDNLVPASIWPVDLASRSTPDHMVRGDPAPDFRVDCASTCRSSRV